MSGESEIASGSVPAGGSVPGPGSIAARAASGRSVEQVRDSVGLRNVRQVLGLATPSSRASSSSFPFSDEEGGVDENQIAVVGDVVTAGTQTIDGVRANIWTEGELNGVGYGRFTYVNVTEAMTGNGFRELADGDGVLSAVVFCERDRSGEWVTQEIVFY